MFVRATQKDMAANSTLTRARPGAFGAEILLMAQELQGSKAKVQTEA